MILSTIRRRRPRSAALLLAVLVGASAPAAASAADKSPPAPAPAAPAVPPPQDEPTPVAPEPTPPDLDLFGPDPEPPAVAPPAGMDALRSKEVRLVVGGREVTGLVTAVDSEFITLVDAARAVVMVPRAQIGEIHQAVGAGSPPASSPVTAGREVPPTGNGLLAGGILLSIAGAGLTISGVTMMFITPDVPELWAYGPPGALVLTGGVVMTVEGSRRRHAYRRALFERFGRVAPLVARSPGNGWVGGFTLRF